MSYTITYTNGGTLAVLADQTEDSVTTSLTLVGKNYNGYGSALNNNFVHLLENFANETAPVSPMLGQLWYDSIAGQIKVYTDNTWKSVGAPTVSATQPASLIEGDFWYDSTNSRLWYYNGINLVDLSKQYNSSAGKSGGIFETVVDTQNNVYPIINFYLDGSLVGWFANQNITLNQSANPTFSGISTSIQPGLTLNSVSTATYFNGTATSALSIQGFTSSMASELASFLNGTQFLTTSSIQIEGANGLKVGNSSTYELQISGTGTTSLITGNTPSGRTDFGYINSNTGYGVALSINGNTKSVSLGTTATYMGFGVAVKGSMVVDGDLVVLGTGQETFVSNLYVENKNIYLSTGSNSDAVSSGAGIEIAGSIPSGGDDAISWLYDAYLSDARGKGGWESSRSINIRNSQDGLYIAGNKILDSQGLYVSTITNVTNFSVSATITVGNINQDYLTITTGSITSNGPLTIDTGPSPNNYINVSNSQITGALAPTFGITTSTVTNSIVATKGYVDSAIASATGGYSGRKPYTLSVDVTGFTNTNEQLINILNQVLPVDGGDIEYYAQPPGARCSILCSTYSATSATFVLNLSQNQIPAEYFVFSTSTTTVVVGTGTSTAIVVTATEYTTATTLLTAVAGLVTVTGPMPTVSYKTKLFEVIQIGTTVASNVVTTYSTGSWSTSSYSGATISVGSTDGISAGATMAGDGFNTNQLVVEVLNSTDLLVNRPPDTTPTPGASIQFTQQPGFAGWVYLRDVAY